MMLKNKTGDYKIIQSYVYDYYLDMTKNMLWKDYQKNLWNSGMSA